MIPVESEMYIFKGSIAGGNAVTYSWSEHTCFYDYSLATDPKYRETECVVVEIDKKVMSRDSWSEDEDPKWKTDSARHLACSPDQELLLVDGSWKQAGSLVPGVDLLQNFCGTGHVSAVVSVKPAGTMKCVDFACDPHGTFLVKSVIMKARNHG